LRRWKRASAIRSRPVVAIVGGAKVSTKIDLLMNLVKKVDALVIGGGMANTFIAARGTNVGKSLCEHDLADTAADHDRGGNGRLRHRSAGRRRRRPRIQGWCRQ
jgi:3-phosphoglycerate kinase